MRGYRIGIGFALFLAVMARGAEAQSQWRAGVARQDITPSGPIWMGGYASRKHPSEGVLQPLGAKALVLEDRHGERVVFVCMDLIGVDGRLCDDVGRRVFASTGISRERIIFNSSHTHCGPVVAGVTPIVYDLDAGQQAAVDAYSEKLKSQLVALVEEAAKGLFPAGLSYGEGEATFGANRRAMRGRADRGPDPAAPVDHGVPVLSVRDGEGALRAIVFGYACHGTTTGIYQINGDYPGYAQAAIESRRSGVTALFMAGCGADINPHPRSEIALSQRHGETLATVVNEVLEKPMLPLHGPLRVWHERLNLRLADPPDRLAVEGSLTNKDVYKQRLAKQMLAELSAGRSLPTSCQCTLQAVGIGKDLVMVALPGEPVVDYALRLRRELVGQRIWASGYCNEIFAYVPSERVLVEGGYEGGDAMVYFGLHGPFRSGIEQTIVDAVKRMTVRQ